MNMNKEIARLKIVPVVVLHNEKDAAPLADALAEGGLPVAEVTFRTDKALESIRIMAREHPEILLGGGTVTTVKQAADAVEAGAKFLVTPGVSVKVIQWALDNGVPVFPGTCTPTEIMMAMELGLEVVKFFPASQYGGLATIKALAGPFPKMRFMPTGGINAGNIRDYLAHPQIIACGGSWMVKDSLVKEGRFDEIARLTREAVELVGK